ncbi:DUF6603 domain-containing protein [Streptomyces sp. NPDC058678]|uniref:DUF6603 domain-containing protein n=1 Tax=Streptomyces sp. NPDC058678 TaxID=3346595 RepID=UPI00365E95DF
MNRVETWLFEEIRDLWSPLVPPRGDADAQAVVDRFLALLRGCGWAPEALGGVPDIADAAASAATAIEQAADGDPVAAMAAAASAAGDVADALSTALPDAHAAEQLLLDVVSELLAGWLARRHRGVGLALRLLGILRAEPAPEVRASVSDPASPVLRPASTRVVVDLEQLQRWLRDPAGTFAEAFLSTNAEDAWAQLGPVIAEALTAAGVPALWSVPTEPPATAPPVLWIFTSDDLAAQGRAAARFWCGITIQQDADSGDRARLNVVPVGELKISRARGNWTVEAGAGFTVPVSIGADGARLDGSAGATASLAVSGGTPAQPVLRLGAQGGPSLLIDTVAVSGAIEVRPGVSPVPSLSLTIRGLRLVMGGAGLDGFLSSQIPDSSGSGGSVDVALRWSGGDGLTFTASGGFDTVIAERLDLGPVSLRDIRLVVALAEDGVAATATFDVGLAIGPISGSVEALGVGLGLSLAGPAPAVRVGPHGPKGVGLTIRAGEVGGGGYLFVDEAQRMYAGAAQLTFKALSFTAVGLVVTRAADGSDGWSMLLIVTAEFPPIPLGFGFTLTGLGGLLGIHRGADTKALSAGVRTGGLDSVLFPRDPVARAKEVIADIRRFFPAADNRFTVGVMAKLTWGPGALLQIETGLILELPSPLKLIVLGRLRAELPDREHAVAVLRLEVLGVLDFGRGEISVDATLRDSRVGPFAISGDMAVRGSWGPEPGFAQSAGGFHPAFEPPPGFPTLRRLAIALGSGENPRLRLESYLALTPNTIQVGANLEVYASTSVLGSVIAAEGHLGFDALVTLVPFSFTVRLDAGVSISVNGRPVLQARLVLTLTGPEPWHVTGFASVSLFLIGEVRVPIDLTFGVEQVLVPPEIDLLARLLEALRRPSAVTTLPPPEVGPVALRGGAGDDERVLHPAGRLRVTQREVPLGKRVTRFGAAVPSRPLVLDLIAVRLGGAELPSEPVGELFAPGPFEEDLPEDQQLRRPAFEEMRAGREQRQALGGFTAPATSVPLPSGYEQAVVTGATTRSRPGSPAQPPAALQDTWAAAAVTQPYVAAWPQRVFVHPERHLLATRESLAPLSDGHGTSAAEAYDRLRDHPEGQVVRVYEAVT